MQEKILDALRRGAYAEALDEARSAAHADPLSADAQLALALSLGANGLRDEALAALDHGIELSPENDRLHVQRAMFLLGRRDLDAAKDALSQALTLNPNQFDAYLLQAQLALAAGDPAEAERISQMAARVSPEDPRLRAVDAGIALQRGDAKAALSLATKAVEATPDDPQALLPLGLAHVANGHLAFAEQAFRRLLERTPEHTPVRLMLVQALQRQGRSDEALEALEPLLADGKMPTPAVLRGAAGLALQLGRDDDARQWTRRALRLQPVEPRNVAAFLQAWHDHDAPTGAKALLEEAIAAQPGDSARWQTRLALATDREEADAIIDRWNEALPDDVVAMAARMQQQLAHGDRGEALASARRITTLQPGHANAQAVIVDALKAEDPQAAIAHVQSLLSQAGNPQAQDMLSGWLGALQDEAGDRAAAVAQWSARAVARAPSSLPLSPVSLPVDQLPAGAYPAMAAHPAGEGAREFRTLFLWGPPGSCVENIAACLSALPGFRADRFSPGRGAPDDGFQRYSSVHGLSGGELDGAAVIRSWQAALLARGITDGRIIDWLVWWDNAFLRALRPHLADAAVLFVVRDPRDMLLEWLAHGSAANFAIADPGIAAAWLATGLSRIADVVRENLFHAVLLKIDGIESDADALRARVSEVLGSQLSAGGELRRDHFPSGRWRDYRDALEAPFATLSAIAVRLGYPEN